MIVVNKLYLKFKVAFHEYFYLSRSSELNSLKDNCLVFKIYFKFYYIKVKFNTLTINNIHYTLKLK